jgi:murein L,D-transpeptidase YcbB/YkuD
MKRHTYLTYLLLSVLLLLSSCGKNPRRQETAAQKENVNQAKVGGPSDVTVDSASLGKYLYNTNEKAELLPDITRFYQKRDYKVAWSGMDGPGPFTETFLTRLGKAAEEGLRPGDFHTTQIKALIQQAKGGDEKAVADLDILLTTEFSRYTAQLNKGITRLQRDETGWKVETKTAKYDSLLTLAMSDDSGNDPFALLEPKHPEYQRLKKLLASYQDFAKKGGWPPLAGVQKLKLGDTAAQVVKLREILAMMGDLQTGSANFFNPKIFDRYVDLAVKAFQTRHGLNPDGVVSGQTLDGMNVSVKKRIEQILVNMERWRLMPDELSSSYLLVNVPEFKLHVFDEGKEAFQMRVVVGKEYNATPVFSDKLEYIVFSPYWNVPKSITIDEILPALARNPNFLSNNNMEVVKGWNPKTVHTVPAWEVPWYNIENDDFDYWIRQRPGGENPLGLVKFVFPNSNNVYLHDTPFDQLFEKVKRNYSHGCIRLSDPVKLAKWLLRDQSYWDSKAIDKAMHAGQEQYVRVKALPVYIVYFTTWVDPDGTIQVRDDIYGIDETMAAKVM